jgi:hypothetical protein
LFVATANAVTTEALLRPRGTGKEEKFVLRDLKPC